MVKTNITIKKTAGKIPLKLFVGQITKDWSENELIKFFKSSVDSK